MLAALEGDTERAATLLRGLTATRSAASTAAAYEVVGRMEGWTDGEFADRKVERVIAAAPVQQSMSRDEYFARFNALAYEESMASRLR